MYTYTWLHISYNDNAWADILGSWSIATIRGLVTIPPLLTASDPDLEGPTVPEIRKVQHEHLFALPNTVEVGSYLYRYVVSLIWISDDAPDLQMRICIIGHSGASEHRGRKAIDDGIRSRFHWSTVSEDVQAFVRACIRCLSTTGERPYHVRSARLSMTRKRTIFCSLILLKLDPVLLVTCMS